MVKLSANQESFVQLMTKSEEHARKGFELLITRPEPEFFFDAIEEAGLFSSEHNPGPIPADDPGYFRIPYWGALDYLEVMAKRAEENENLDLAHKVMKIIRDVGKNSREGNADNHHTWRKFAELIGLLPSTSVTYEDLDMLPRWLNPKFDSGGVAYALEQGALKNYLASESSDDWKKACRILYHCTAIRWENDSERGENRQKPSMVVDDYWLKKLINKHSRAFGEKCGGEASRVLGERVQEYFRNETSSFFTRPAVEDHPQNHEWERSANALVEGLRDVMLAWTESAQADSQGFVDEMLTDDNDMIRRIGIYALDQRWAQFGNIYGQVLEPQLFTTNHIHELYHLLKNHFDAFGEPVKEGTIEALRQLPQSPSSDDPERSLKITQRQWLSAVYGKGYETADHWYEELDGDPSLGTLSQHPGFHFYTESFVGMGPSPYSVAELIEFAEQGTLIDRLNSFTPKDTWRGSSKKTLVDVLATAIQENPGLFLQSLPTFATVHRPYQYGIISGFKALWDSTKEGEEGEEKIDWPQIWQGLFAYIEQMFNDPGFWTEDVLDDEGLTPTRDWIPPIIAEFLQAGTKKDEHAYPPDLLPVGWRLIQFLLERVEPVSEPSEDAMTQAINSPKGKAIKALFNHALRVRRLADQDADGHAKKWDDMRPVFEGELAKCKNNNYEFSTLAAAYLANLEYLDKEWLESNLAEIFPKAYPANFNCALDGLTFAQASRSNYKLLVENDVIEHALRSDYKGKHARERLIQRVCLAYLWGDEELDSPRFAWMFENQQYEDLKDASDFFWSVSNQELEAGQKKRIVEFLGQCMTWSNNFPEPPKELLSSLSRLSCYLPTVAETEQEWLLAVAPHVNIGRNFTVFIEELDRLADTSPAEISIVLSQVLESYSPLHDYKDHLKELLIKLINAGRHEEVIVYADRLRNSLPKLATEIFSLASDRARQ